MKSVTSSKHQSFSVASHDAQSLWICTSNSFTAPICVKTCTCRGPPLMYRHAVSLHQRLVSPFWKWTSFWTKWNPQRQDLGDPEPHRPPRADALLWVRPSEDGSPTDFCFLFLSVSSQQVKSFVFSSMPFHRYLSHGPANVRFTLSASAWPSFTSSKCVKAPTTVVSVYCSLCILGHMVEHAWDTELFGRIHSCHTRGTSRAPASEPTNFASTSSVLACASGPFVLFQKSLLKNKANARVCPLMFGATRAKFQAVIFLSREKQRRNKHCTKRAMKTSREMSISC